MIDMGYRFMRVIVSFDLPTLTSADKRNYSHFRKFLLNEGFAMLHESLYSKLTLNATQTKTVEARLEMNKPPAGSVFSLAISEKQFARINYILGEIEGAVLQTDERLVVI